MRKLPEVAGLILCKRMEVNTATVELCLAGLFHTLEFSRWPALARPFTVFAQLFDAQAEGIMELTVTRLETEGDIYRQTKWFASADRRLTYPLEWRVTQCRFPAPGRYLVALRLDGQLLSQRYLEIKAKEPAP
jgi:hypothetical protein